MPNWCMNDVTISGTEDQVKEIMAAIEKEELLEYLAPVEGDWSKVVDTWGVKWDISNSCADVHGTEVSLTFDSPWGPPLEAFEAGRKNLGLTIESSFYEPGSGIVGRNNEMYNVNYEDKNWRDEIPDDIINEWDLENDYEHYLEWQEEINKDEVSI